MTRRPPFDAKTVFGFAITLTVCVFLMSATPPAAAPPSSHVSADALDVAVKNYNEVRYSAPPLELCERADEVALAYLRAFDRAGYRAWEAVEEDHCRAAGFAVDPKLPNDS